MLILSEMVRNASAYDTHLADVKPRNFRSVSKSSFDKTMLLNVNISDIVFHKLLTGYTCYKCVPNIRCPMLLLHPSQLTYYSILSHAMYVFVNLICPLALPRQEAFKVIYSKFYSQHFISNSSPSQDQMRMEHMRLIYERYKIGEFMLKL